MKEEEKPGRSEPIKTEKERRKKKFENECCKLARAVSLSGCGLCFPAFFFRVRVRFFSSLDFFPLPYSWSRLALFLLPP